MTSRTKLIAPAIIATLMIAPVAALAVMQEADAPEETAAETPEQKAARELCMETAEPGAWPGWSISQGETCQNSFANVCKVTRKADGAEASHTCYVPPPMPEEPMPEAAPEQE